MSGDLFLFPSPDEPGVFDVARLRGGKPSFSRAAPDAPLTASGDRVVLIVPGEDVTLHAVDSSVRSEAQAQAAARFAIEDDLAEPIEDVELLLAQRVKDQPRDAFVASRSRLAAWREALAAVGLAADVIVPDYALLPVEPGVLLVVDMGQRVIAHGPGVGFAVDVSLAPDVLDAVLATRPALGVRLQSSRPDAILSRAARARSVEIAPAPDDAELIALASKGVDAGSAVNFARVGRAAGARGAFTFRPWRLGAGIAAAAAAAFLALLGVETVTLSAHAATARAEADAVLHAAFPDLAGDPRAALRALSAGASQRASFLELSAVLSEAVAQVGAMEIESLRFDDADGRLSASVAYVAYSDVQQLKAAVEARGLQLTEGASRMQGGRMAGEIAVGRP